MAKRTKITVMTHPNGYSLSVAGREYMTFSTEQLLAAIFTHVGCAVEKDMDVELSKNILTAAASWPTVGEAIKGNAVLMKQITDSKREERIARKQLTNEMERYDALYDKYKDLKELYGLAAVKADKYEDMRKMADDNYNLYNKEVQKNIKLNRHVERLEKELSQMKSSYNRKAAKTDGEHTKKKAHRSRKEADALILKELGIKH